MQETSLYGFHLLARHWGNGSTNCEKISLNQINISKRLLSYEPLPCIHSFLIRENSLGQLSQVDNEAIKYQAIQVGSAIEQLRLKEQEKLRAVESIATREPESLPPPGEHMQRVIDFLSKFESSQKIEKFKLNSRIDAEMACIDREYASQAQTLILSIQNVQWRK